MSSKTASNSIALSSKAVETSSGVNPPVSLWGKGSSKVVVYAKKQQKKYISSLEGISWENGRILGSYKEYLPLPDLASYICSILNKEHEIQKEDQLLFEAQDYLDEYNKLDRRKVVNFGKAKQDDTPSEENRTSYHNLIERFLEMVNKYYPVDIVRIYSVQVACEGCFSREDHTVEEDGFTFCGLCGYVKRHKKLSFSIEGTMNVEDGANFHKAFLRYQGLLKVKLAEDFFDRLSAYFASYGGNKGKDRKSSRIIMYRALAFIGEEEHYVNINYICFIHWGWPLPQLMHVEDRIMQDYFLTQKFYVEVKGNRKSNINTQLRLLKHLQVLEQEGLIDEEICPEDFKLTLRDSLEPQEEMWKEMCKKSGLPFIPTL